MKVIFINPPVIRSSNSCPENEFRVDGFVLRPEYRKIPGSWQIYRLLNSTLGLGRGVRYGVRAGSRWPFTMSHPQGYAPFPFFMAYAAAYLRLKGISANILDAVVNEQYSYERFLERLRREEPHFVILEGSLPTLDIDLWIAEKVSRFSTVAMAGPHMCHDGERILKDYSFIRYVLQGEYILNTYDMVQRRERGVCGSRVVDDLDEIPFPMRDFEGAEKYWDPSMPTHRPQLQIYGSKGCPYKCTFCSWPQTMYQGKVSLRRPEMIAREIREAIDLHGYKSIFFDDDTFNLGSDRVAKICDELRKTGLPWTMMGRLDASPEWLFDKMVDSGCVGMRFGIESFNLEVLRRVKKGLERSDFQETLRRLCKRYPKLMIHLTMMRDLPGQTEGIHREDLRLLAELGFAPQARNRYRHYQLSYCVPYPGTELYEQLVREHGEGLLEDRGLYDGSRETLMRKLQA